MNKFTTNNKTSFKRFKPGTIRKLISYMADYRFYLILVVIFIISSAAANASASLFLQTLIDKYILPLMGQPHPDFSHLLKVLMMMGSIYLGGVLSTLFYNRIMVVIAEGTLRKIRDKMFKHMETLPIKFS